MRPLDPIVALEYRDLCGAERILIYKDRCPAPVAMQAVVRRRLSLERIAELTGIDLGWECPDTAPGDWPAEVRVIDQLEAALVNDVLDEAESFLRGGRNV